jgi:hypothetical protein
MANIIPKNLKLSMSAKIINTEDSLLMAGKKALESLLKNLKTKLLRASSTGLQISLMDSLSMITM